MHHVRTLRSLSIYLVLLGILSTHIPVHAASYVRTIEKQRLVMSAPRMEYIEGGAAGYSYGARKQVRLSYDKQTIRAKTAILRWNSVQLRGGYEVKFPNYTLEGKDLVYNFNTNEFSGKNVTVNSDWVGLKVGELDYHGQQVIFKKAKLGLQMISLGLGFEQITLFPGWTVIKGISLESLDHTWYYIPYWVLDQRRNAFQIPYPLPEAGATLFRGNYWTWNTHYYFNEMEYGFFHVGGSQWKGAQLGLGNILRLSDQDQFYMGCDLWQAAESQPRLEYNHSFLKLPPRPRHATFQEMVDYNRKVKDLDSSDIRLTYTEHEEINNEEIDRDVEAGYRGHFKLTEKWGLDLSLASGHLFEYSSNVFATRTLSDIHFTYDQPVWIIEPLRWGLGYNRSDYDIRPWTWQRVDGTVEWQKDWWLLLFGIKYKHYFYQVGNSPFRFDQKYAVPNHNITYSLRLGRGGYNIGVKYLVDIVVNELVDTTYFGEWTLNGWVVFANYSTLYEAFSMGLSLNLF